MRVLFLLTQDLDSPSGLGRFLPLARELNRLGHPVKMVALHPDYDILEPKEFSLEGVKVQYVAPMHVRKQGNIKSYYSTSRLLTVALSATWNMGRAILSTPMDIIHIGKPHPMNSLAGLVGGRLRGAQIYLDCDDYEAGVGHFTSKWQKKGVEIFENWTPHRVDYITTNTFFTQERLISEGVAKKKIFYLSNGVDRMRFLPPSPDAISVLREQLGLQEKKVVSFIGSLGRPHHPVDLLFQAFSRLYEIHPDVRLMLVGGGEDYLHLKDQAATLGLEGAILFCGRVAPSEVVKYYHLSNVSVDPVYLDAAALGRSPLKLFESWACGVPFVSADVGDRRILLGEPPAGILTQPGDVESLTAALIEVLDNPDLAARLRQRGLERVQGYYWDKLAASLERIYLDNLPSRT